MPKAEASEEMARDLEGLRILVVEDEYLVAMDVVRAIEHLGGEIVGPVGRLEPARDTVRREAFDGAVLDLRLDGATSLPLAEELLARNVPIILATGYDASALPESFGHVPRLKKPFNDRALQKIAIETFRRV